jgi:broad specificity phosphatase PhoE
MGDVVWLLRHGNRVDFVDPTWRQRAQRPDDPPLAADGIAQIERAAERLRGVGIAAIFASPFLRAVQSAHIVANVLDLDLELEPGLGEHLNPDWFSAAPILAPASELRADFPRLGGRHAPLVVPRYPETTSVAYARAARTVARLADRHDGALLCVGHGASVTGAALGLAGGSEAANACPLAALFRLVRRDGVWTAELRGDTAHLDAAVGAERLH